MYFFAILIGILAGAFVWFAGSYWIASSIVWAEDRHPQLAGSKGLQVGEGVACGLLFLVCIAVAFFIARLLIQQQ